MKTYTTIAYSIHNPSGPSFERSDSFIRSSSAKKPSYTGAARMVAAKFASIGETVRPSNVSIHRVEMIGYNA